MAGSSLRFVLGPCLATFVAMLASFGCGKSGSDGDGGDKGGSGTGAASNGGSSGDGSSTGGSSTGGSSTGGTGGSGGTDATGGMAGEGGESTGGSGGAMGGTPAMGGSGPAGSGSGPGGSGAGGAPGGSGGNGGSSGMGGAGGGSAGRIGILGTSCTPRGALACAGNHQKLTVLCGGDDTWQPNLTCGDGQFCDSLPGPNVGTCRPELPECAEGPGTNWCAEDDKNLVTCGPDAVSTSSMPCDGACRDATCRVVSECPVWTDYNQGAACVRDCGTPVRNLSCDSSDINCTGTIGISFTFGPRVAVRTPWADQACTSQCNGTVAYVAIQPSTSGRLRVTVPPPWRVAESSFCGTLPQCQILSSPILFYAVSSSLEDGPVNVVVEAVDNNATCP